MEDNNIIKSNPARFPNNSTEELESVYKLLDVLDKNLIKPDPKILDKFPNTDGEITIVNIEQFPMGKCEIQIKTLPEDNIDNPKYQCDKPFLKHCEISLLPVILIVVNAKHEKIYWLHISRDLIKTLAKKIVKESISVAIPIDNEISRINKNYIIQWTEIIESYKRKIIDFENLEAYTKKLEEINDLFKEFPKPIHKISEAEIKNLQLFIDTINNALDNDFKLIKETLYPNYWKLGIAFSDYGDKILSYAIYPLKYGQNDLLVKEIGSMSPIIKERIAHRIVNYFVDNPIKDTPIEYGYKFIKEETLSIIKNKYIKLIDEHLAFEYISDFVDDKKAILPNEFSDSFDLNLLSSIVELYLPIWYEEYLKIYKIPFVLNGFIIEHNFLNTTREKINQITESAKKRYSLKEYSTLKLDFIRDKWDLKYLRSSIRFLLNQKMKDFERPFPQKSFKIGAKFVWDWYPTDSAYKKVQFVYNSLPKVFDLFVETLFPNLKKDLKFFNGFNLMLVNVSYKSEFNSLSDHPSIEIYYLQSETPNNEDKIKYYLNEQDCPINRENLFKEWDRKILVDGSSYKLKSSSGGNIQFLYEKLTLEKFFYEYLYKRFEDYFKILTDKK